VATDLPARRNSGIREHHRASSFGEANTTKSEIEAARDPQIILTPDEQLAFWNALNEAPTLTDRQRALGAIMRGETG
jgi:hypothetical protein